MAAFDEKQSKNFSLIENGWFYEKNAECWPGVCNGYEVKKIIAFKRSKYQEILLFDTVNDRRILVLDGVVQFDTKWEHIYHEMMVHVPLFAHPNPRKVLVLGGGDGGCVREVLKHVIIEQVVWCEIDKDVIQLTKEFCPTIHTKDVYTDKRVKLLIDDGIKYVKQCKDNTFDVIIVDGSDPIGTSPSASLFTTEFYQQCHRILKDGGIINSQNECLFDEGTVDEVLRESVKDSKDIHKRGDVRYCTMYTPMYTGGQLGCLVARKYCKKMMEEYGTISVDRIYREISNEVQKTLKYYSAKMHTASFVLPFQFDKLLSKL